MSSLRVRLLILLRSFEKEGYEKDLALEFSGKLMAWLINHVANTDQKISDYADSLDGEDE